MLRKAPSIVILITLILCAYSCAFNKGLVDSPSTPRIEITTFSGWWVYGEGQHIFKNEKTLEEYDLIFPNENMEKLVELYLSVCEMEYFPMESQMMGSIVYIDGIKFLQVQDFEILHIQGCGEESF